MLQRDAHDAAASTASLRGAPMASPVGWSNHSASRRTWANERPAGADHESVRSAIRSWATDRQAAPALVPITPVKETYFRVL